MDKFFQLIPSNYVFFDIETTGLKRDTSFLYLIGCIYFEDGMWKFVQFFNDDGDSEKEILLSFFSLLHSDTCLVHYNGLRFDVPYVDYRRKLYGLDIDLHTFQQFDLYRKFSKLKNVLLLDKRRQKDLEVFFGLSREDLKNGGELIPVYYSYLRTKDESALSLLLLHNEDDVLGLFSLLECFLPYDSLRQQRYYIEDFQEQKDILSISFSLPLALPREIRRKKDGIYFQVEKSHGILSIPIVRQELKFFYPNYKEYYYLPTEDCAIHKSIAQFVEKNYRKKATAKTCYQKKEGIFLPISKTFPKENLTHIEQFRQSYSDKQIYIEYNQELPSNFWKLYIHSYYLSWL